MVRSGDERPTTRARAGSARSARRLAGFLAVAGTSHFVAPGFYDRLVWWALRTRQAA